MAGKIVQLKNNKGENIYPLGAADWSTMIDKVYPVGSIYMSVNDVSPSTFFGGTWEKIEDKFLLSSGSYSLGDTGGEASHKLTAAELPKITGDVPHIYGGESKVKGVFSVQYPGPSTASGNNTNATNAVYRLNIGGDEAHNNMPPYLVVNMWKRTA